jgi:hypothetical protein
LENIETSWTPQVGLAIRRRHDPEAPKHRITGLKGTGAHRTVSIDEHQARFWPVDMFEPADPPAPRVELMSLLDDMPDEPEVAPVSSEPTRTPPSE